MYIYYMGVKKDKVKQLFNLKLGTVSRIPSQYKKYIDKYFKANNGYTFEDLKRDAFGETAPPNTKMKVSGGGRIPPKKPIEDRDITEPGYPKKPIEDRDITEPGYPKRPIEDRDITEPGYPKKQVSFDKDTKKSGGGGGGGGVGGGVKKTIFKNGVEYCYWVKQVVNNKNPSSKKSYISSIKKVRKCVPKK